MDLYLSQASTVWESQFSACSCMENMWKPMIDECNVERNFSSAETIGCKLVAS